MHTDVAGVYNTLSIMKDMGKNTMCGTPTQKWLIQMPSTGGKMKMGWRSETHTIISSVEECKSATTQTHNIYQH